ncbi:hypothetical protein FB567DRAFT_617461 [Paraphoma chrysanthemicola]|uniref:FTP domain-containing protein n=1 Tax=Paraphoma chrysanthemicola TaxID=798071 RepID=A0A8K0W149_9PLEO|nr:hypothetical protein FB567DRAFT_617461 [Paraphoma chrysanthemicola]
MADLSLLQSLEDNPNIVVGRADNQVHSIDHLMEPWTPEDDARRNASQVTHEYLAQVAARVYGIPPEFLQNSSPQSVLVAGLSDAPPSLEISEVRPRFKSTAVTYQQTLLGLPVWRAGVTVTLNEDQEVFQSVNNFRPAATEIKKPQDDAKFLRDINADELGKALGLPPNDDTITIDYQGLLVYRYMEDNRQPSAERGSHEHSSQRPGLPLRPVPSSIRDEQYYVVRELLFTFAHHSHGELSWRAFIEVETGTVLYLRARIADVGYQVTGSVFSFDPITRTGDPSPGFDRQKLSVLREKVVLNSITPVSEGAPQTLKGSYAEVKSSTLVAWEKTKGTDQVVEDSTKPIITAVNHDFDGEVDSDVFAAVNAYHHVTSLFSLLGELGFKQAQLFKHTVFPVPLYYRSYSDVNAYALAGKNNRGSGGFRFGVATENSKISIAADFRLVAHEFGHALLYDAYGDANFGFAHSAGDSLAVIFCDPTSKALDRGNSFPWVDAGRRHDHTVDDGWGWGGEKYNKDEPDMYDREQILSSTLFRLYEALGGAKNANRGTKVWASRYTLYLIVGGIATLTEKPRTADIYVTSMMNADSDTISLMNADSGKIHDFPGGAVRKVIRWAFEKQGLYQPNPAPVPVTRRGLPPQVDVYIDDGRNGEYDYKDKHDSPPGLWNRNAPDGGPGNQYAVAGRPNYIYVTIRNRGTDPAKNLRVKAYLLYSASHWDETHSKSWELPLQNAISTTPLAPNKALQVGPFPWTPNGSHTTPAILVSVSADGDLSNIDPASPSSLKCARGPTELSKLVPFDNNLAMRYF